MTSSRVEYRTKGVLSLYRTEVNVCWYGGDREGEEEREKQKNYLY